MTKIDFNFKENRSDGAWVNGFVLETAVSTTSVAIQRSGRRPLEDWRVQVVGVYTMASGSPWIRCEIKMCWKIFGRRARRRGRNGEE
jgi:hypothetical protein